MVTDKTPSLLVVELGRIPSNMGDFASLGESTAHLLDIKTVEERAISSTGVPGTLTPSHASTRHRHYRTSGITQSPPSFRPPPPPRSCFFRAPEVTLVRADITTECRPGSTWSLVGTSAAQHHPLHTEPRLSTCEQQISWVEESFRNGSRGSGPRGPRLET